MGGALGNRRVYPERGDCTGEKEVKGGDFIKKKPEEINQKGTLYRGLP